MYQFTGSGLQPDVACVFAKLVLGLFTFHTVAE
jgi:hypothetical protein